MIEELKLILDSLGDLSGVAIWVVGGFMGYKTILWASTTGAVFVLTKLFIEKLFEYLAGPRHHYLKKGVIQKLAISSDGTDEELMKALRRLGTTSYIHDTDVKWLNTQLDQRGKK